MSSASLTHDATGGARGGALLALAVVALLLMLAAAVLMARRRWPTTAKTWLGGGAGPPVVQAVELHAAVACDVTRNEGGDVPLRLADSATQSAASVVLVQAPPTVSVHV